MSTITFLTKDLPSRGAFYPNTDKIFLKRFSCEDVANLGSDDRTLLELISDFKKDVSGITPDNILYVDFLHMSFYRTATIYANSKLSLDLNCPYCKKELDVDIDYTSVELDDESLKYLDLFPVKLSINEEEFDFNIPTVLTIETLVKLQREKSEHELYQKMSKMTDLSDDDRLLLKSLEQKELSLLKEDKLLLLENSMKLITYGLLCSKDTLKVVNTLKTVDSPEILETLTFIDDVVSRTFKPYTVTCKHCGREFKISLEGLVALLRPFCTSKQDIANRLRTRKKS